MYLSHPVRRIREDPAEDETVTLRITAVNEDAAERIARAVAAVGTVDERLRFGGLLATVPQVQVADVCALDGIEAVETDGTLTIDADGAGEDVDAAGGGEAPPEGNGGQ